VLKEPLRPKNSHSVYSSYRQSQQEEINEMGGDDDFSESELEALDISRERKKFASNMFG